MLDGIKAMIAEKKEFLDTAEMILEDGIGLNLDESIILGEAADPKELEEGADMEEVTEEEEFDPEAGIEEASADEEEVEEEEGPGEDDGKKDDIGEQEIDDGDDDIPKGPSAEMKDDLLSAPIDGDEAPAGAPAGMNFAGSPVDPIDDILNVQIDTRSNTVSDVLPVPPSNASEALAGDEMSQKVASGFGQESADFWLDGEDDILSEAISLSGGDGEKKEEKDGSGDSTPEPPSDGSGDSAPEPPTDGATDDPGDPPDAGDAPAEENDVTAAVRDKVAEADADTGTDTSGGTTSSNDVKKTMDALSKATKELENAKKAVMNSIPS